MISKIKYLVILLFFAPLLGFSQPLNWESSGTRSFVEAPLTEEGLKSVYSEFIDIRKSFLVLDPDATYLEGILLPPSETPYEIEEIHRLLQTDQELLVVKLLLTEIDGEPWIIVMELKHNKYWITSAPR